MRLHAIGFGSLNVDQFWEVTLEFLRDHDLRPGEEYIKDVDWFTKMAPILADKGTLQGAAPGGSAANMIAALYKMGFSTGFYGVTGKDDTGILALETLGRSENLKVRTVTMPAGRCWVLICRQDPWRDRALVLLPNANDLADWEEPDLDYFLQAQWLHLTSFVSQKPLEAQIRLVERLGGSTQVSFDPGAVYAARGLGYIEPILQRTDLLFITQEELQTLTSLAVVEAAVRLLFEVGVRKIVMKRGPEGMIAFLPGRSIHQVAVAPGQIRDRTGAGDVVAAGFLAGMIESVGLEASLQLAAIMASKSIEGYGRSSYPDKVFFHDALSRRKRIAPLTGQCQAMQSAP